MRKKISQENFVKFRVPRPTNSGFSLSWISRFRETQKFLNGEKSALDIIPKDVYIGLAKSLDLYKTLKARIIEEMNGQLVNNSWLKCYEIVKEMGLICDGPPVSVFFNCELPGGFICAVNHFAKTNGVEIDWLASSLLPQGHSAIAIGDIYGVYRSNPEKWLMGPKSHDGDVTSVDVIDRIRQQVHEKFEGGVDLYMSDAGVSGDCFNDQEKVFAVVNLGQVLSGLQNTKIGGTMVVKQYTFFLPVSVTLVAKISTLFEELFVVKPRTSRPINSEVYLVGKGFGGLSESDEKMFVDLIENWDQEEFTEDPYSRMIEVPGLIDKDPCLESIFRIGVRIHAEQQVRFIRELLDLYRSGEPPKSIQAKVEVIADLAQERLLEELGIKPISRSKYISWS